MASGQVSFLKFNEAFMLIRCEQVDAVLGPSAAYFVDYMHDRSAEALAANSCVSKIT
jgi:hypothetical protein